MNIPELILKTLDKKGEVKANDIVRATGFSRTYINRFFQHLRDEGLIVLIGKANKARYIRATEEVVKKARQSVLQAHRILKNENLQEDLVLAEVKKKTGFFLFLKKNVSGIVDYAFLEMLNNAIEHSRSEVINIDMKREEDIVRFDVADKGVGIFNNIMQKNHLNSEIEAIQDLLKGKQSTSPKTHTGEGIFFTSKVADILTIQSSGKKLIFNNLLEDIFIRDIKEVKGTKVSFSISIDSKKDLDSIFRQYTDDSFEFNKTRVVVRLYKMAREYISRSQARRILTGLEKFKSITLDFEGINTVGQGFADEIFRVWKTNHPKVEFTCLNINENIEFMIKRAKGTDRA